MAFKDDFKKAEDKLMKKLNKIYRAHVINMCNTIIIMSPVLTGRFRANWQFTINVPATIVDVFAGIKQGKNVSYVEPIEGLAAKLTLNDTCYLTNNLPYALALEDGHSPQRSAGWVKSILDDSQKFLSAAIKTVGK